jgi:hypothetical protein
VPFVILLLIFVIIQFMIALLLRFASIGPRLEENKRVRLVNYLDKLIVLSLIPYAFVVIFSAITAMRLEIWFFLHAFLVGMLSFALLEKRSSRNLSLVLVILLPVIVIFLSLVVNGPMPITQDEGGFTGLAYQIIQDGGWKPGKIDAGPYYQFFPFVPYIRAAISEITGLDLLYFVHPLTVLVTTFLVCLSVFIIVRNLSKTYGAEVGFLGPILFALTAPITTLPFIPSNLATSFFLISFALLTIQIQVKSARRKCLMAILLISVIGVMIHPEYLVLFLSALIPMMWAFREHSDKASARHVIRWFVLFILFFAIVYWTYASLLDFMINSYARPWTVSLIQVITGQAKPFEGGRPVWYNLAPIELAYAWTLLPALSAAYIFGKLVANLQNKSTRGISQITRDIQRDPLIAVGIVGLLLLGIAFITRASAGFSFHRYLMPTYVLLIPVSALFIGKIASKRAFANTVLIIILVSTASFYAIKDPALSPDVYQALGVASKRTWNVAESLTPYAPEDIRYYVDQRVEIGFEALLMKSGTHVYTATPGEYVLPPKGMLLVLNLDEYGRAWAEYRFASPSLQQTLGNATAQSPGYSLVYTDGLYKGYFVSPNV